MIAIWNYIVASRNEGRKNMNAQFKKGALELCVLAQLETVDCYGYELTEAISLRWKLQLELLFDIKRD